jgi:hypothetical protein
MRTCVCNVWNFIRILCMRSSLCVVWLLICVLTVVSASCFFLLISSLRVLYLNASLSSLSWTGPSFCSVFSSLSVVYFLYYFEYRVVGVDGCVIHLQSFITRLVYMIFFQCIQMFSFFFNYHGVGYTSVCMSRIQHVVWIHRIAIVTSCLYMFLISSFKCSACLSYIF